MEAPEHYQDRTDRQDRRDQMNEVKARQKKLEEKYGTATATVDDDRPEARDNATIDVVGADCPDCEDGVIRVVSRPNSYPNFEEKCTECGSR